MALIDRQADLTAVITTLQALVRSCDQDLPAASGTPDYDAITRIREQASQALGSFGENSGEAQ